MEPTPQQPQATPESTPEQTPAPLPEQAPESTPPTLGPIGTAKKSKKPLIITLIALAVLVAAGCAGWYWWSGQQPSNTGTTSDLPVNNATQQKALEPYTLAYSYNTSSSQSPSDLFWRSASGGERQNVPSKANVGSTKVFGNQVLIETFTDASKSAPGILYSNDGGKTYEKIFTGKAPVTGSDMGDQITSIAFAGDGKSVVFALLPNDGENTVKRIFFDKPSETVDVMSSDSRGVFISALSVTTDQLLFTEGCYNCDGNSRADLISYDLTTKAKKSFLSSPNEHASFVTNKAGTLLLGIAPTIDKTKTNDEGGFFGYYVGAPYTLTLYDVKTAKSTGSTVTVGTATEDKFVRGGFMIDDKTPYYHAGNQLHKFTKSSPQLLYEAGQPIHEVFYVSESTVFASAGDNINFTLNRFGIKTQETKQLLTGDDSTTRIFGITEQ